MTPTVTLWQNVHPAGSGLGGSGTLYVKVLPTPFLPRVGDDIHILFNPEEREWSLDNEVKRIFWNGDGSVHAELLPYFLDPTEQMVTLLTNPHASSRYGVPWWTDRDGTTLEADLVSSGWLTYEDYQRAVGRT